jgi:hypothetical protein
MSGQSAGEPIWHTGRRCDGGQCVEIGTLGESILIRSSEDPGGRHVEFSRDEWQMFVDGIKDGDFDYL